jgi:branched-chain amino acid transport system permease protein
MTRLFDGLTGRELGLLGALIAVLVVAPMVVDDYILTVLIIVLYLSYTGQAWNLMLGFAGQLSLGHALFVGLGAYMSAALFVKFGIAPWLGVFGAVAVSVLAGSIIGYLGFRFSIRGVYFALLTIAFAEFTRVILDHVTWLGGTEGMFLPVANRETIDLLNLRGSPVMFYYVILALTFAALALCRVLLNSKLGFYWRAIREDQEAAQALGIDVFRYKMIAVMVSSGLAGIAGVFYAFYYNNLFPGSLFSINQSIEMLLGPVVGGVGTLFGPILGAFVLTPLGEVLTALTEGWGLDGIKQFFWGAAVVAIVLFRPSGLWPWIHERLGLGKGRRR